MFVLKTSENVSFIYITIFFKNSNVHTTEIFYLFFHIINVAMPNKRFYLAKVPKQTLSKHINTKSFFNITL